ncbi:MAG: hypothetical protein ACLFTK_06940 [Anaerolineales bacterium]
MSDHYDDYDLYDDDDETPDALPLSREERLAAARERQRRKRLRRVVLSIVGGLVTLIFISVPLLQAVLATSDDPAGAPTITPDIAPALLFQQAGQAAANDNHTEAITLLTRAIRQAPNVPELYAQRGQSYVALDNVNAARGDYLTYATLTGEVEPYMAEILGTPAPSE